jgi:hypothetical protein
MDAQNQQLFCSVDSVTARSELPVAWLPGTRSPGRRPRRHSGSGCGGRRALRQPGAPVRQAGPGPRPGPGPAKRRPGPGPGVALAPSTAVTSLRVRLTVTDSETYSPGDSEPPGPDRRPRAAARRLGRLRPPVRGRLAGPGPQRPGHWHAASESGPAARAVRRRRRNQ